MAENGDSIVSTPIMAEYPSPPSTGSLQSPFPKRRSISEFGTEALYHAACNLYKSLVPFMRVSTPQKEVTNLYGQAKMLETVSYDVKTEADSYRLDHRSTSSLYLTDPIQSHLHRLWDSVNSVGERCSNDTVGPLQDRLNRINGPYVQSAQYDEKLRLPEEDLDWYKATFRTLKHQTGTLRVLKTAINLANCMNDINERGELSGPARDASSTLQPLIAAVKPELYSAPQFYADSYDDGIADMRKAIQDAEVLAQMLPTVSINVHYHVPRHSRDFYTGRQQQMQNIEDAFRPSYPTMQKRFVIQGQPGTGKTELALKYAEEHLKQYWGIFWVDASSRASAALSYGAIANIGGVEPNEQSAKHWLSNCVSPWLLVVDNADDDEPIEDLLPSGDLGCVLVTTRNPRHITYGIVGRESLELGEMNSDEAKDLLLRAAHEPTPWTETVTRHAMAICKHLHFLPLALVHAGKAIVTNVCKLGTYITHFEGEATRIRRERHQRQRSRSSASKRIREDEASMMVFGSYEILHQSLVGAARKDKRFRDALQLLHVFSYMHCQNILLNVLVQAAVAPLREAEDHAEGQRREAELMQKLGLKLPRQSWLTWLQGILRSIASSSAMPPVLPEVLKNPYNLDADELEEDITDNLHLALGVLVSRSLVVEAPLRGKQGQETERYHMHPMVHKWVRERPQLSEYDSVAYDALVCQYAKTILSRAVRLEGGNAPEELAMRRDMKPHVDHVRRCAEEIQEHIQRNARKRQKSAWLIFPRGENKPVFGPLQAQESARFARVYIECGDFTEAYRLLKQVEDFLVSRVGHDHPLSQRVKLARSEALYALTQWNDAAELLGQVYESRRRTLGNKHPLTLQSALRLASSTLSQGRMTDSLEVCEVAHRGLMEIYGAAHSETLKCINQIGKVHSYYLDRPTAVRHYEEALRGMEELFLSGGDDAPPETDVLLLMEDLAIEYCQDPKAGKDQLQTAEDMMHHVVERRTAILGKEQPFTLLAKAGLGRTMAANGRLEEAAQLMGETLEVAQRNVGPDNLAVLAGKGWYAQVLIQKGDLNLAERWLRDATDERKYSKAAAADGEHPDRIMHVWHLARCLELQGKFEEALELCRELKCKIPLVGGHGLGKKHRFNITLAEKTEVLERKCSKVE